MRDVIVGFIVWPALIALSYPLYALFELRCYLVKRKMKGRNERYKNRIKS